MYSQTRTVWKVGDKTKDLKRQKGLFWSFTAASAVQREKLKKVLIRLLECTSPWVAVGTLTTC